MYNINEYSIGDIVKIKSTGEITEINSISVESGGYYIYLKNGYRANDVNELCKVHKLTNYERIKNMTIEEMAKSRVKYVENDDAYMGDFSVEDSRSDYVYREEEALKREIAWLNSEVE